MMTALAGRMRLVFEVQLWRRGWVWLAGPCLLVAGLAAVACVRHDIAQSQAALSDAAGRNELLKARRAREDAARHFEPTAAPPAPNRLDETLRPADSAHAQVDRIYATAIVEQVNLSQAEFRYSTDAAGITRMEISLPVNSSYPKLRGFVESLLRDMPNLSIDSLSFRRNQVGQPNVEAHLRMSLWRLDTPPAPEKVPAP